MSPALMSRLVLPLTALAAFGLGWLGRAYLPAPAAPQPVAAKTTAPESPGLPPAYARQLRGRFLLDSADYAGFEFLGGDYVIWRNEITREEPETLYINWLSKSTFIAKSKIRRDSVHAPLVWLHTVDYYDGHRLRLRDLWTGWGPFSTDTLVLRRQRPE